jgi:hypothetical protein
MLVVLIFPRPLLSASLSSTVSPIGEQNVAHSLRRYMQLLVLPGAYNIDI